MLVCLSLCLSEKDWRTRALDEPATLSAAVGALSACNETAEADRLYANAIRRGILLDPAAGGTWSVAAARAAAASTASKATTDESAGASTETGVARAQAAGDRGCESVSQSEAVDAVDAADATGTAGVGKQSGDAASVNTNTNTLLLWVDVRRVPVEIVSAVVRRVVRALAVVGGVSDGLVVEWGGGRWSEEDGYRSGDGGRGEGDRSDDVNDGGGPNGGSAFAAGRRGNILKAFAGVEPPLEVTEPSGCRGQVSCYVMRGIRGRESVTGEGGR